MDSQATTRSPVLARITRERLQLIGAASSTANKARRLLLDAINAYHIVITTLRLLLLLTTTGRRTPAQHATTTSTTATGNTSTATTTGTSAATTGDTRAATSRTRAALTSNDTGDTAATSSATAASGTAATCHASATSTGLTAGTHHAAATSDTNAAATSDTSAAAGQRRGTQHATGGGGRTQRSTGRHAGNAAVTATTTEEATGRTRSRPGDERTAHDTSRPAARRRHSTPSGIINIEHIGRHMAANRPVGRHARVHQGLGQINVRKVLGIRNRMSDTAGFVPSRPYPAVSTRIGASHRRDTSPTASVGRRRPGPLPLAWIRLRIGVWNRVRVRIGLLHGLMDFIGVILPGRVQTVKDPL